MLKTEKTNFLTGKYFISANTQNGFYGFFDTAFSPYRLERVYIIHGGSGTGKSSMMRKIKNELPENVLTQELYCSSDGDSLDGVLFHRNGKTVGIVDGTPPHARISVLPGLRDEEWNFADYLKKDELKAEENEILRLQGQKKEAYRSAYALLSPLGACHKESRKKHDSLFAWEKAHTSARRILKKYNLSKNSPLYEACSRFIRAFSMKGEYVLQNWWPKGTSFITVSGSEQSTELYLFAVKTEAEALQIPCISLLSPLSSENLDALYFPGMSLVMIKEAYASTVTPLQRLNAIRFLQKPTTEEKTDIRRLGHIEADLKEGVISSLLRAGAFHFSLEKLHAAHMNFPLLSLDGEKKRDEILSLLS